MTIDINSLTLGQIKKIGAITSGINMPVVTGVTELTYSAIEDAVLNNFAIGKKVIIRTYAAGVWFGTLSEKAGKEVILTEARRMWRWWAAESISLRLRAKLLRLGRSPKTTAHIIELLRRLVMFGVKKGHCPMPDPSKLRFEMPKVDNVKTEALRRG